MDRQLSVVFSGPEQVTVTEQALPLPAPGAVRVRARVSAISAGSELLVLRGQAPHDVAVDDTIGALGQGGFGFPIKYGYACVGVVDAVGAGVDAVWLGQRVFVFNPHESAFVTGVDGLIPVPDDVSDEDAAFLPNMETAVNFLLDGAPLIGERVVVVGQGIVGLLTTALLARLPLAALVTLDTVAVRREWSQQLGATVSFDPRSAAVVAVVRAALGDARSEYPGADVTFEVSGNPVALQTAIQVTGFDGRVVVGSWYGQKAVTLDLGGWFHRSRVRLISSQVSTLTPGLAGRWDKARRLAVAWRMLAAVQPSQLITQRFDVAQAAKAYQMLLEAPETALQVVFTYD